MPASSTDFQNAGFLPASAKLAGKYRLSRWNTGHLVTLPATMPVARVENLGIRFLDGRNFVIEIEPKRSI